MTRENFFNAVANSRNDQLISELNILIDDVKKELEAPNEKVDNEAANDAVAQVKNKDFKSTGKLRIKLQKKTENKYQFI